MVSLSIHHFTLTPNWLLVRLLLAPPFSIPKWIPKQVISLFCFFALLSNMPLRLAAWLLSLASSNIVLIKNRWEANRRRKMSWNLLARWRRREKRGIYHSFPPRLRLPTSIEMFVQVCFDALELRMANERVSIPASRRSAWWISSGEFNWAFNFALIKFDVWILWTDHWWGLRESCEKLYSQMVVQLSQQVSPPSFGFKPAIKIDKK